MGGCRRGDLLVYRKERGVVPIGTASVIRAKGLSRRNYSFFGCGKRLAITAAHDPFSENNTVVQTGDIPRSCGGAVLGGSTL